MLETSKILSLRDIASQINSAGDLLEILSQLIFAACRHGNWTMGSIMSIDTTEGIAQVIARYDPALVRQSLNDRWNLTDSPALVALQRNEPIYIRDVRESENFTGYRRESLERDYRSVMVIPMHCDDFEGRPMVLSVLSRPIVDLTDELLAFMDVIVHLGAIAVDRYKRLEKEKRASKDLQQVLQAHTTLLRHVLENGSVSSLARMVHELFDERAVVVDLTANQVLAGMPPESVAMDADAWGTALGGPMSGQLVKAVRNAFDGVQSDKIKLNSGNGQPIEVRARIEALTVDQESVGALVTFPGKNEPDQFENMMLESVRFALSIQMMRNFIRFRYESRTQSELFLELVEERWKDTNEFHERARRLGIDLRAPHQLIAIRYSSTAAELKSSLMEAHHVIARMLKKQDEAAVLISMPNGFVCLVPSHSGKPQKSVDLFAKSLIDGAFYHSEKKPVLIISSICEDLPDYPVAWKRCERMIEIALSFGQTGVLSRQDFGPLPILIAAAAKQDVHAFVEDNLGALDEHDRRYRTAYLETLLSYVREGCRSQACADAMGIHVTTLRYRLMRMNDLFGIDVGTPEKRFAVELALHLHKLVARAE